MTLISTVRQTTPHGSDLQEKADKRYVPPGGSSGRTFFSGARQTGSVPGPEANVIALRQSSRSPSTATNEPSDSHSKSTAPRQSSRSPSTATNEPSDSHSKSTAPSPDAELCGVLVRRRLQDGRPGILRAGIGDRCGLGVRYTACPAACRT